MRDVSLALGTVVFAMSEPTLLLVFHVSGRQCALRLVEVERVVRAVEVAPLPKGPPVVLGVINVAGEICPVLSMRSRFGLEAETVEPRHQFVLARAGRRKVALVVDEARAVLELPTEMIFQAPEILPGLESVKGIATLPDGLLVIHDLERFLSLDEASALDAAMEPEALNAN
jgi:purine-binding chemotaxis protein CheW